MSFALPVWLVVAGVVAAGVVIAHLIAISQPRRDVLPTVRFIPQTAPLTVTRTKRPTDLLLLLARLTAVALLGLALAGAHLTRSAPSRVVIADLSDAVADTSEVRDSLAALGANAIVVTLGDSAGPATLSGALVAAHRALAGRDQRERAGLVIVSPILRHQVDSATAPLLALWPGPIRVARVQGDTPRATEEGVASVGAPGDDPVAAALASAPRGHAVRMLRDAPPTAEDSAWVRASRGVLVVWPALGTGLKRREPADAQYGIAAGRDVVIGTFARTHDPRDGDAIVRWLDGAPAATESSLGEGCIREVAIPVDMAGDMALRESFRRIVGTLTSPCGGPRDLEPAELATILPAEGGPSRAAAPAGSDVGTLPVWLAFAALAVLAAEQLLRRNGRGRERA